MGIDYGRRRVGVAVSDGLGLTAQPVATIESGRFDDLIDSLKKIVADRDVKHLLVGHPVNMDGTKSAMTDEVEKFAASLRAALDLPLELWDERLTSWQAEEYLSAAGISKKKQRKGGKIDMMAAQLMLQSYLDAKRHA